jgi:sulfur-carrier protein
MKVYIPTPLWSYTGKQKIVESTGATIAEILAELERRYPGLRFRIIDEQDAVREHIRIFINGEPVSDLSGPTLASDTVYIVCALSGGL